MALLIMLVFCWLHALIHGHVTLSVVLVRSPQHLKHYVMRKALILQCLLCEQLFRA